MSFDYLLRVPIIFFMDELFKSSFELSEFASIMFPVNSTFDQIEIEDSTHYFKIFIKIIVSCLSKLNKFSMKKLPYNVIQFNFSSVLFFIMFVDSSCQVLIPSVFSSSFCLCCIFFILEKHTNARDFI